MPMRRAAYRPAVAWIAENDDNTETDAERLAGYLTVALVAELFGVEPERVARDVLRTRAAHAAKSS